MSITKVTVDLVYFELLRASKKLIEENGIKYLCSCKGYSYKYTLRPACFTIDDFYLMFGIFKKVKNA